MEKEILAYACKEILLTGDILDAARDRTVVRIRRESNSD